MHCFYLRNLKIVRLLSKSKNTDVVAELTTSNIKNKEVVKNFKL